MPNKMATMQGCCCQSLPPIRSCFQCTSGTPRYFDVTIPRTWAKRAATGVVVFEMAAGTYRCEQQPHLSSCTWRSGLVGSYSSFTNSVGSPCPGASPITENMYVAAQIQPNGLGGIQVQFGAWREASGFYSPNFHIQGLWATTRDLGTGVNCKTINEMGSASSNDVPGNNYCVEGSPFSYFGYDAGSYQCEAVP